MQKQRLIGFALFSALACGCGNTNPTAVDMAKSDDLAVALDLATAVDLATIPDLAPATIIVNVGMGGMNFSPKTVTIRVNDTIKWVWASDNHSVVSGTVTAGAGVPDGTFCNNNNQNCGTAPLLTSGSSYSNKFAFKGTYPYFCQPHAGLGMTGTITVN